MVKKYKYPFGYSTLGQIDFAAFDNVNFRMLHPTTEIATLKTLQPSTSTDLPELPPLKEKEGQIFEVPSLKKIEPENTYQQQPEPKKKYAIEPKNTYQQQPEPKKKYAIEPKNTYQQQPEPKKKYADDTSSNTKKWIGYGLIAIVAWRLYASGRQ